MSIFLYVYKNKASLNQTAPSGITQEINIEINNSPVLPVEKENLDKNKIIFEVNNEKLNQLRPKIKNGEENNRGSHLIEFVRNSNKGNLRIENFNPLTFQELRCELINFFYNSPDRSWKSYEDIQQNIFGHNTETIRKTIKKINERVIKHTNNKYPEIIESKTDTKVFNSPKQYRWKF